jgi:glycerate kinase
MSPLLGPTGAAQMFAPQKGARVEDVVALERALTRLASAVRSVNGTDLSTMPGTGAGGGVAFLPAALLGGDVVPGAELVLDLLGIDALLDEVDAVVTGEGSWDAQTVQGKAPEAVRRRAVARGVPVAVVAGQVDRAHPPADVVAVVSLSERAGSTAVAAARATELLEEAGRDLARSWFRRAGGTADAAPSG